LTKIHKAEIILLSTTLIWGGTFAIVKGALDDISPLFLIGIRFLFAAILFVPFIFHRVKNIKPLEIQRGVILGLLLFFGFAAQTIGMQYTTASKAAFLTGTMVIFTPVLQFVMGKKAPKIGNILGVLVVTVGLYLLTSPKGSQFNFGDGLNLMCAIIFAIYTVYLDTATQEGDVFTINFVQILTNGIISIVAASLFESVYFKISTNSVFSILYLTLCATMLTLYLLVKWQRETTPTRAAVIYSLEPVIATVFAFVLLNEILPRVAILGSGIIILGLLISEFSDKVPFLNSSVTFREKEDKHQSSGSK
jgi:drug/metabolite transporter (DMT)-like permease